MTCNEHVNCHNIYKIYTLPKPKYYVLTHKIMLNEVIKTIMYKNINSADTEQSVSVKSCCYLHIMYKKAFYHMKPS